MDGTAVGTEEAGQERHRGARIGDAAIRRRRETGGGRTAGREGIAIGIEMEVETGTETEKIRIEIATEMGRAKK